MLAFWCEYCCLSGALKEQWPNGLLIFSSYWFSKLHTTFCVQLLLCEWTHVESHSLDLRVFVRAGGSNNSFPSTRLQLINWAWLFLTKWFGISSENKSQLQQLQQQHQQQPKRRQQQQQQQQVRNNLRRLEFSQAIQAKPPVKKFAKIFQWFVSALTRHFAILDLMNLSRSSAKLCWARQPAALQCLINSFPVELWS